jgi:nucleoside diphosphate kinase
MGAQVEKTLALIKPDAVKNGDTDNILQVRVERRVGGRWGDEVAWCRLKPVHRHRAGVHIPVHNPQITVTIKQLREDIRAQG